MYVHKCTVMYMNYNVPAFRARLKEAFNLALAEEPVIIERGGMIFRLEHIGSAVALETNEKTHKAIAKNYTENPVEMAKNVVKVQNDPAFTGAMRFCPNGHPKPEGRDRCLGKGCKYS